jgi:serine protease Do
MLFNPTPKSGKPGRVKAHRFVLLATASSLAAAALFAGPSFAPSAQSFGLSTPAHAADNMGQPTGFADLVEKVKPAVISVRVKMEDNTQPSSLRGENVPMERFFRQFGMPDMENGPSVRPEHHVVSGQGSGFFISADGYAVTNNHVVDHAKSVQVLMDNGKTYDAKVIGTDPKTDLALIKVEGGDNLPFVKLADKAPRVGDWVLAVGNPFGLGGTVTAGIVSARGRDIGSGPYDDFIQIDAPVNKGNSGGPTFDVNGNVIGVNTAIYSPSGGSVGIGFDIPSDTVKSVVAQLKDKGVVTRGWIGVQIQPVTDELAENLGLKSAHGAIVDEPQADSPAEKAGIQAGDVITAVNGNSVKDARNLARTIGTMAPDTSIKLTIVRNGDEKTLSLTLGELPNSREARADIRNNDRDGASVPHVGLTLAPARSVAGAGGDGVVVVEVDPSGPAADHGFRTGDVILDVGGKSAKSPADIRDAFKEARSAGKHSELMRVRSGKATHFVALPLGHA